MNAFRWLWALRPPVSPWWMYQWLRDWNPRRPWWHAAIATPKTWWLLWRWAASPAGYGGDYEDVQWGVRGPTT